MRSVRPARRVTYSIVVATLAAGGLAAMLPAVAATARSSGSGPSAGFLSPVRLAPLAAGEHYVCPAPSKPGEMQCTSIVRFAPGQERPAAGPTAGYSPANLRSAYNVSNAARENGRGETIAIVDAFRDPTAVSDLATYRSFYNLPACTEHNGCLRIVNEHGKSKLPPTNRDWAFEESLDLDAVSALCSHCHILLIEANSSFTSDLGIAEDTAVEMHAKFISNSWGSPEFPDESSFNHFFNHPGIAVSFAAGDSGYGTAYPADIQYVTAVGGTSLVPASNSRGWSETVWGSSAGGEGTGSGCSRLAAKASWQIQDLRAHGGCLARTGNDISAIADPSTGIAVFSSFNNFGTGWLEAGGTSLATPVVSAIYALAGVPTPRTYPAEYPYLHTADFYDVTSGSNGSCPASRLYLCTAKAGYDAPTGLGTPIGMAGLADHIQQVTLLDPGNLHVKGGRTIRIKILGLNTDRKHPRALVFRFLRGARGLRIFRIGKTSNAVIVGKLRDRHTVLVLVVIARDKHTHKAARLTFRLYVRK